MSGHLANLISVYHDLRDRYGSEDPLVKQLQEEVQKFEKSSTVLPFGERRNAKRKARYMFDGLRGKPSNVPLS